MDLAELVGDSWDGEPRALHVCDVCGGVDDHSRHSFAGMQGFEVHQFARPTVETYRTVMDQGAARGLSNEELDALLNDLMDTTISDRHRDCCRATGCPTGECDRIAALGGGDLRGADLLQFIMDNQDLLREEFMSTESEE